MPDYWFKADLKFICPSCNKESMETVLTCAETKRDPYAVAAAIKDRARPIACQHCKEICPDVAKVHLLMNDLTPEELSKINFGGDLSSKRVM